MTTWAVFSIAALLTLVVLVWALRAYRRAEGAGAAEPGAAIIACASVVVVALGAYVAIGRPDLPDAPYEARLAGLHSRDPASLTLEEALAVLNDAGKRHPADPLPFLYAGQLLQQGGRAREAAAAFDAALRRDPRLPEAMMGLGRAMVALDEGRVSPEAMKLFQQAGALTSDPAPWIYQAMGAMQHDHAAEARRYWQEALTRMEPDDPRREMARRMSRELGR